MPNLTLADRCAPGQQQILLKHVADIRGPNAARAELLAMPANLARVGRNEPADHVQERGLSAPRRSDNGDDLALAEHEAQIAHHGRHFVGR